MVILCLEHCLFCSSLTTSEMALHFVPFGHGKLDFSFVHGRVEKCIDLQHKSMAEIAEENNLPRVLEK